MGPAPGAGPLTFDFAGQQQQACAWSVFEYDNVDGSGANGSGAVAQQQTASGSGTTLAAMLGPLADAAASLVVGGMVLGTDEAVSAGAGLAQIDLQPFGQGGIRGTLQTEDRTGGGSTVDWSWPTTANAGAIALEIKAASVIVPSGPATDAETLARRFEPVLFFSANEQFFPADAKRYVERCALWRAQAPFDAKDSLGRQRRAFPAGADHRLRQDLRACGRAGHALGFRDSRRQPGGGAVLRFQGLDGCGAHARAEGDRHQQEHLFQARHDRHGVQQGGRRRRRSEAARQPVLVPRRAHRGGSAAAPARDREGTGPGQGV